MKLESVALTLAMFGLPNVACSQEMGHPQMVPHGCDGGGEDAMPGGADDDDWYPSIYGADDEIGAANRLTPDVVRRGVRAARGGRVYSLAIVTGPSTPAFPPRGYNIRIVQPGQQGGATLGGPTNTTYNDDIIDAWLGIGTQIDGLGHVGIDNVYYNGHHASDFAGISGLTRLGVQNIPPIVTRGVVLDIAGLLGVERMEMGQTIGPDEIRAAMAMQRVQIEEGDVVLLHTGWLSMMNDDPQTFATGEPGLSIEGADLLVEMGVTAVGADNWAVEVLPAPPGVESIYGVHQTLLARNGIYILENIRTDELVRDGVDDFLFVLAAPRFEGAVQTVAHPIAIP